MSNKDIVLKELYYQFRRADNAYQSYLTERIYLYASSIRKANNRIYQLLEYNLGLFDDEQSLCALELMAHYDVWMAQFDQLVQEINPSISATFVFERFPGSLSFPKEAKEAFMNAYKK
ncbi:hypothetical protein [Pontibacter cellulosilyticus]|uniref:Uncharacterized protein n=1 Tax=Pontibacter cellulosilyticus TaxID=1720253 RepID=A0A923SQE0_9BACT|nr:hypothetical protein [Pontibacter cellulosilyticus]MBC5995065.1 hypothetical protein [Pontibacter cellulosilyticus]